MATEKNPKRRSSDELRPEYDLSQLKGGVKGKHYARAMAGTNLVLLDPDLAEVFPTSRLVNEALRVIANAAKPKAARSRGARGPA